MTLDYACTACGLALTDGEEGYIHVTPTAKDVLRALKCPAWGRHITQPYKVSAEPTFSKPLWERLWRRNP